MFFYRVVVRDYEEDGYLLFSHSEKKTECVLQQDISNCILESANLFVKQRIPVCYISFSEFISNDIFLKEMSKIGYSLYKKPNPECRILVHGNSYPYVKKDSEYAYAYENNGALNLGTFQIELEEKMKEKFKEIEND